MSLTIYHADRIVTGNGPTLQHAILVEEDGKVVAVTYPDDPAIKKYLLDPLTHHLFCKDHLIIPGFIDIHTHGAIGHDFVEPDQTKLNEVAKYFASEGTTSFNTSTMAKPRAIEKDILKAYGNMAKPIGGARWIGVHNEGPYLNMKFKAMMEAEGIRPIVASEIDEDVKLSKGKLRMITVAPESVGIEALIEECHRYDIAVMFAHTDATAAETLHALEAGGDGFTHLYNAMTQHTHRNPGAVSAALLKGDSFCELITDGYHIDPLVVKLTYQILTSKRLILITDSNPGKGLGDGEFEFGGITCMNRDGKAYAKDTGRIAGSTIGMIHCFKNILEFTGCTIEEAVEMTSLNAAKLLKLDKVGSLKKGNFCDFTVLDSNYDVVSTHVSGKQVYVRPASNRLYKILPVFNYRVWGGNRLKEKYGYVSDLPNIGECYNVIAMKGHLDCTVEETNEKLSDFFISHRDLFQSHTSQMPIRAAMANPIIPMSIQLHPNDEYAMKHDGRLGKPDGVYFIEGESTMVLGHTAQTIEEFKAKVENEDYDTLVRKIKVKAGEFVDVPFGTLHAFGGGVTLIEYSQNADLTYRLYDYKRIDPMSGTTRQLHIQAVLDNVIIPNNDTHIVELHPVAMNGLMHTVFHDEPGVYTAGKLDVSSLGRFSLNEFYFLTVLEGQGKLNSTIVKAGETWFVPCKFGELTIAGKMEIGYVTYQEKEPS